MLETALKKLFDYQRFERNAPLQSVIDEVMDNYAPNRKLRLSDDELAMAAGGTGIQEENRIQEPDHDGSGTI